MKSDTTRSLHRAWIFLCCSVAMLISSIALGQVVNGRLITSVYTWKQYDTVDVSKKFARGFQSVLLDVTQGDFSLHGNFQGAVMLQHRLDELPDYRLYSGYAQWKNIASIADLSFGRLPFFVGVGSGTIDGALTRFRLAENKLRVTVYGGASTPLDLTVKQWGSLRRDFTVGGQVLSSFEYLNVGLSYMNRQRQRPGYWSTLRPDTVYVDPNQAKEQYASADASYSLEDASFHARYDYNLDYNKTQRAQMEVRYYPSEHWALSTNYIHRAPQIPFNSFFAVFSVSTSDELEGGVDYMCASRMRVFVRGAFVQYVDDRSFRYTLGIANDFASASYRGNTGYAGELNAISLQGSYPFCDRRLIPNLGVSLISYKLNESDNTENTLAAVLGVIARPLQMLSFDIQGQWLKNKVYKNDLRLYAGLNIWFTEQLHFFE